MALRRARSPGLGAGSEAAAAAPSGVCGGAAFGGGFESQRRLGAESGRRVEARVVAHRMSETDKLAISSPSPAMTGAPVTPGFGGRREPGGGGLEGLPTRVVGVATGSAQGAGAIRRHPSTPVPAAAAAISPSLPPPPPLPTLPPPPPPRASPQPLPPPPTARALAPPPPHPLAPAAQTPAASACAAPAPRGGPSPPAAPAPARRDQPRHLAPPRGQPGSAPRRADLPRG